MSDPVTQQTLLTVASHTVHVSDYQKRLQQWGFSIQRVFPWRETDNPFHILMAELMLRRTRASQVASIFSDFVKRYSDPESLALACPDEVAQGLYSLGLAWRIPAFQQVAKRLVDEHSGNVPTTYDELIELPGVGDYVASAVCCFAFKQCIAIVDTNTVRVVGRLFGLTTHAESRRRKPIRELINRLVDCKNPRDYNYNLLDLAALLCLPSNPRCEQCPLVEICATGQARMSRK